MKSSSLNSCDEKPVKYKQNWHLRGCQFTVARSPEWRLVGNYHHFATLLCAMLRHHGIPTRAPCGLSAYFGPGMNYDHLVCEYWNTNEQRWMAVDELLHKALQRRLRGWRRVIRDSS